MQSRKLNPRRCEGRVYRNGALSAAALLENLEGRTLLSTYVVTNVNDAGAGSLRQAILDANANPGPDTIKFAIGSGAKTISPTKSLPGLGDGTTLDATTQPGYVGKPLITLNGTSAGGATDGLRISGSKVTVRGLSIRNFGGNGILVLGSGGNKIAGNYLGTDGNAAHGNKGHGIIVQSPNNVIGGTSSADRNVISGNGSTGVFLYTSAATKNVVSGNYVGTDATGTKAIPNQRNGVQMDQAPANVIGGTRSGARNVISGNARDGVLIINNGARLNAIQGNFIGTDVTGTKRLGNGWYGVEISRQDNVVGGAAQGAGNVVSANGFGGVVFYLATSSGNRVQGNFIGTDVTGTKALGNGGRGLEFTNGAHHNYAGGEKFSERNVISANEKGGVGIYSGSHDNVLQGNYVGTNANGTAALGNNGPGVIVTDKAGTNFIGGRRKAGNTISGNTQGVALSSGVAPTLLHGNKIGTNAQGDKKIPNATDGIYVGSSGNQIGGRQKGSGNLISGNGGDGIRTYNSNGNLITRNTIGADGSGTKPLANAKNGVLMINTNNTAVRGNTVAYNGGAGVQAASGTGNGVITNVIHSNAQKGIAVGWDVAKSNSQSGYPTLTSAKTAGATTTITGTVTGKAKSSVYVELYSVPSTDGNGTGQGAIFLASVTVTVDGSGKGSFTVKVPKVAAGRYVTATATASGSTSEFSKALRVA